MDTKLTERIRAAVDEWPSAFGRIASLERLTGDASNRIYVRVELEGQSSGSPATIMAMVLPQSPTGAEEYGAAASHDELPFVSVANALASCGVPVPERYHLSQSQSVLLLEDLGDTTLERALDAGDRMALYESAVDLLIDFQQRTAETPPGTLRQRPRMDRGVLAWELEHYVQWRLEADLGHAPGTWREALKPGFESVLDALVALPQRLIHRDFQSRNLMRRGDGTWTVIDFQDALIGPVVYDSVALLRDSYVVLSPLELDRLLDRYIDGARAAGVLALSPPEARRAFHLQTVQRKLKDTGRFVYIDRVKGNPSFLPFREPSMAYVRAALAALPELNDLRALLDQLDPSA